MLQTDSGARLMSRVGESVRLLRGHAMPALFDLPDRSNYGHLSTFTAKIFAFEMAGRIYMLTP